MTTSPADSEDRIPHESNHEDVGPDLDADQDAGPMSTVPAGENPTVPGSARR
jgi:hypothetical protein